ncbi:hypothetical protein F5Y18DRAFT_388856 [Xylariaceae sp. FL1019]|nr:hypothetical protein F5Y18DRAFT_388856 [Xylariaceae sp. FL1019]
MQERHLRTTGPFSEALVAPLCLSVLLLPAWAVRGPTPEGRRGWSCAHSCRLLVMRCYTTYPLHAPRLTLRPAEPALPRAGCQWQCGTACCMHLLRT